MIDLFIVLAFVAWSVTVGLLARRRASRGLSEYFLAGRSLRGWRAGISMAATQFAADTPMLVAGLVAMAGVFAVWRLWSYGIAFLIMGFLLARLWRRAGVLTDAELTVTRYSGRGVLALRALKAVYYGTVINCVVMALVLVAATRIFEIFLPWHEWLSPGIYSLLREWVAATPLDLWSGTPQLNPEVATTNSVISILCMLGFVALYSTTGGLRSVVRTDVMQFAFMMAGTLLYAVFALRASGGRDAMLAGLARQYGSDGAARLLSFTPPPGEALMPFLVVIGLQWAFQMNSDGTGYLAQRTMACEDDRQARIAGVVFTFAQIVLRSLLWLPIVVALLVIYPFDPAAGGDQQAIAAREMAFARGMDELLPAGARGVMLTGMLAALASTLDTHLNWGASYWSNDLYKGVWIEGLRRREARPHELVRVARLSNVALVSLALLVMAHLGSIQAAWHVSLLFGAGVGAVLLLRWLWERVNLAAEFAAIVVSLLAAPLLLATVKEEWLRLSLMAASSTTAVVLASLFGRPTDPERLVAFYRGVRPPGWWGRTARLAGDDPAQPRRSLGRGLRLVAASAFSAYGLLIAGGILLLHPDRWPAAVALLALAFAVAPFWLQGLRSE